MGGGGGGGGGGEKEKKHSIHSIYWCSQYIEKDSRK